MIAQAKETKQQYFKRLRNQWNAAKALAEKDENAIQAIIMTHGMNISSTGYMMVMLQMKQQGLDGLPYLDAKTYQGWKQNGFQVSTGCKSTLSGITWVRAAGKKTDDGEGGDDGFCFPKEYHLFHRSQVQPL